MSINSKSTKAEILAAYNELKEQQLRQSQTITSNQSDNKTVQDGRISDMIKNQVEQRNMQKTITILEHLQAGFGGAVSSLSEQLITEATTLQEITESISQEQQQLQELHQLTEIEENTLDNLIEQYQINHKQFAEESSLAEENACQRIEELKNSWQKEQEFHQREIKQRNETRKKEQERTAEQYQYDLDLARDLDEEEYEHHKKSLYQELESTRQNLEKQWQEKEQRIAQQEAEYVQAEKQVLEFEAQLQAKIKQGEEEGKGIGTYQAKIKQNLRVKEIEGERHNYQLRIQSLEKIIETQQERIIKLSQQVETTQKQVQDLAVKAIEGTSNRQSFEAMRDIAMEQAKTQQKGK